MGIKDVKVRQSLYEGGILTVGIVTSVEPIHSIPNPEEIAAILAESGLSGKHTAHQVELVSTCGYSRPVVKSHIATIQNRGVRHLYYICPHGARVQLGMTVMAQNGAALARLSQWPLSE